MAVDITLGNGNNSATFTTFDSLVTGTGADAITITQQVSGASINLGSGADTLVLGNAANTVSVSNTESITGGLILPQQITVGV